MAKNYLNQHHHKMRGNAMVYVLIALALFGFLTVTLSSQNDQADGQNLSDEQAELYANELISYVASAQQVVDMMITTGSEINDLDFMNPTSAGFDTPPHHHKVFHPAGGGLNYQEKFSSEISISANSGWYIVNTTNVEWTPTTTDDVIMSALRVTKEVCEQINLQITGSKNIPAATQGFAQPLETGVLDFTTAYCAGCEGYSTLCLSADTLDNWSFYNIIAAQ